MRDIGVVIVNYKQSDTVLPLVNVLAKSDRVKIVIVDNSQDDSEVEVLKSNTSKYVDVVVPDSNVGFGRACNLGSQTLSDMRYLSFINPDIELDNVSVLHKLVSEIENGNADVAGPAIYGVHNEFISTAGYFPSKSKIWKMLFMMPIHIKDNPNKPIVVDWMSGAMFVMRYELWSKIGMFDERFFLYYEDIDLFLRLKRNNYKSVFMGNVRIKHIAHSSVIQVKNSVSSSWYQDSRKKYIVKWRGLFVYYLFLIWNYIRNNE